ncbi:MAG: VOC family protein [Candidatus Dormibacteraeota bacterium]|nr:VOC family protein [Candidatus Dormibacteraeota bacterium]
MPLRWSSIVIDCDDTEKVARFWSQALNLPLNGPEHGEWWLEPGGNHPDLLFQKVPEAKSGKNRIHLDLRPEDQYVEVERLIGLGARRIDIGQKDVSWVVLADPEGNEFCVLRPRPETATSG